MIRATVRPPTKYAIQPKIDDQIGIPVSKPSKNVPATVQCTGRENRRSRTISGPTTTSSRVRATTTAESIGARGAAVLIDVLRSLSGARKVCVLVAHAARFLGSVLREVRKRAGDGAENGDDAQRPDDPLPELDSPGHVRIRGQVVPLGMVSVSEDGDDGRPVDARRVVEGRLREAVALELLHAGVREHQHVFLGPEVKAAGRARLNARGLEADRDAVDAERALGHLAGGLGKPRHVERA